jgi:methanethiol S-methyltransferase
MTIYLLIGLAFEERDLLKSFGNIYQHYRRQVPMLIPRLRRKPDLAPTPSAPKRSSARHL